MQFKQRAGQLLRQPVVNFVCHELALAFLEVDKMPQKTLFLADRRFGRFAFGDVADNGHDQAFAGGFQAIYADFHGISAAILTAMNSVDIYGKIGGRPFPDKFVMLFRLEPDFDL